MYFKKLERYLRVNLLGLGPRLIKNNLPGRGLTKVEKQWPTPSDLRSLLRSTDFLTIILYAFLTSVKNRVLKKTLRLWEGAQRRYAWSVDFPNTIRVIESNRRWVGHDVHVCRKRYMHTGCCGKPRRKGPTLGRHGKMGG